MCVSGGKEPDKASLFLDPREDSTHSSEVPAFRALLPGTFRVAANSSVSLRKLLPFIGLSRVALCILKCLPTHKTTLDNFILKN